MFSFGALLYEMVTGHRAFQGDTKISILAAVINKEPEPLAAETPHDLEKIITRCLRKDPARRFQHMEDLKVALEELKEESDSGKLAPAASGPPARTGFKPAWVLLAFVAAGVALAGAWLYGPQPDHSRRDASPGFTRRTHLDFRTGQHAVLFP